MSLKIYFNSKEVFDELLEKLREAREEELAEELEKESEEDCDCNCECCGLEDEDFDWEEDDFEKKIIIERNQIEEKVYEFNFFYSETSELIWSYYGSYDYNKAKEKFVEEFDHIDTTFYLSEF